MKESESLEMIAEPLMKEPGSLYATERLYQLTFTGINKKQP